MNTLKSIWLGQVNVGKTSLLTAGCNPELRKKTYPATMGIDAMFFINHDSRLMCWDTSGHERFEAVVSMFFKQCQIAVIVYDINDPATFNVAIEWHKRLPEDMKVYMVGNKMDLENKMEDECVETYCTEHRIEHFKMESTDKDAVRAFMQYIIEHSGVKALEVSLTQDVQQDCCIVT